MKRFFAIACATVVLTACATTAEKADEKYDEIRDLADQERWDEVYDKVEKMADWYEDLSEEDKAIVDKQILEHTLNE